MLLVLDTKANPWDYNKHKRDVKRMIANLASVAKVVRNWASHPRVQGSNPHTLLQVRKELLEKVQ